ncbi:hypothetical protein H112_07889 [Trichophyton rubrum D6]|uniref:Uncharacterized protein n=3 Tax=Trichophyton TaxID=5550 RepID=A0A080WGF7_TRIRC|nr:uncharacterized protein TERG_11573 [Trichophyton rubrum CBS 118892]EZF10986.1 hypothetical protein H100_07915 [Trichophyton rubrum MR850]EZF37853.1 hypothetical protein H102_07875 [Trichophyton rubrum CBS 100081]EZF48419.1 hypothetical protein H103_07901 [Trichophyton rubrum CBS 288.86]EZF59113.1 hypothetical protein H104_07847 [Trichophyton rubrum CBS 289.86]EZF69670.1 hypothetical protein H105_07901 [Trichophyton soudanense CBS 452.61]EZF80378.1 hypothetical protein H110_07900 [Trichophy
MEPITLEPWGIFWSRGNRVSAKHNSSGTAGKTGRCGEGAHGQNERPMLQLLPHRDRELRCRQTPFNTSLPCLLAQLIADFVFLPSFSLPLSRPMIPKRPSEISS